MVREDINCWKDAPAIDNNVQSLAFRTKVVISKSIL
jgi:hypothetical protein